MKALAPEEYDKALKRSTSLMEMLTSIDWSEVKTVAIFWNDDRKNQDFIGDSTDLEVSPPTVEMITIQILAAPGTLPIPREADGKPQGEGVTL